jgi:glutamate-1-semialdehyde 2,1-aminomutase
VWDADGREYIDFRNALGPVTLGYCYPATDEAVRRQLDCGIIFGHPHPLEVEVAEMVCEVIPCAERARFLKTGGEAIAACIKLARAHTGREHVVQVGYSGWLNSLAAGGRLLPRMVSGSAPRGVPQGLSALHHACGWADEEELRRLFQTYRDDIAALVIAPGYPNMEAGRAFLPLARELTERHGAVLVFDEIVTGFRIALGGAQEYFGVTPDLAVFAKGVANGMPLAVYCGRADIMEELDTTIVSSTYGGETLSLAAAKACIETYRTCDVAGHLWRMGERMWAGANAIYARHGLPLEWRGLWPCPQICCASEEWADWQDQFMRATYASGLSLYDISFVNFSHTEADIAEALGRMEDAAARLASHVA